jgi:hypothetical protein
MTTQEEEEAVRCFETAEAHVGKENGDGALNGSFVLRAWEGGARPDRGGGWQRCARG